MERLGESVSDYAADQSQVAQGAQPTPPIPGAPVVPGVNPTVPSTTPTANPGQTAGNLKQSVTGRRFGMNNVNNKAKALPVKK
jgi:hypothetical protein